MTINHHHHHHHRRRRRRCRRSQRQQRRCHRRRRRPIVVVAVIVIVVVVFVVLVVVVWPPELAACGLRPLWEIVFERSMGSIKVLKGVVSCTLTDVQGVKLAHHLWRVNPPILNDANEH